ncbi:Na(+)-translocating NADH-quinone reductase subunit C [Limisalsivibrio acetivorans]|uniref:Na(+)-translocating NADH-quinone reductase subunit C n=1 Tax=Limisalsivibrio acetivorans TaxID=1304888 RepID=UPI0003B7720B|nr:Na(+)-translocating NADH-quinone reductase subunit C [Limisalsivibrio acetivorans]
MQTDSRKNTIIVALVLSVVCSVLVSATAVLLKPMQDKNRSLERKKNVLAAAELRSEGESVDDAFEKVTVYFVDIETGEFEKGGDDAKYFRDFNSITTEPETSINLTKKEDIAGIGRIAKEIPVYLVFNDGELEQVILPVYGSGLWSTMFGFMAVEGDLETISGLTFYDQQETPGLGGEVSNPRWQDQWEGKKIYNEKDEVAIQLVKGGVDPSKPGSEHKIDALSGASLTSRGVENLVKFWLSDKGFGTFLDRLKEEGIDG